MAAITAQYLEEALTGRFGLEWTARDDGHGFEIKGISGEMMRLFSSRRESISADLRARAEPASVVRQELALSRAAQQALALAQQEKSSWTRADLVKYLGRVLPRPGRDPARATALLEDLADRILRSEFEPVLCLEAPEPAEVPRGLLRAGGRSVRRRHGGVRYATCTQLTMEDRLVAQAAPRLSHAAAARALGADTERLLVPTWPPCAPPPKPAPPAAAVNTTKRAGSSPWPPATARCARPTRNARPRWPRPWKTAPTGNAPPASSGS